MAGLANILGPGALLATLLVAGCSGGGASQPPSSGFSSAGSDCKSTKAEMGKLVNQGVENDVNAAAAGRALSPEAQSRVDRYNALLESYLGNRCHV